MRKLEFVALQVQSLEQSKIFYTEKLGFQVAPIRNPEAIIFQSRQGKEASFAIRKPLENIEGVPLGKGVSLWFAIDEEIEELYNSYLKNKIIISGGMNTTPFGPAFSVEDPDGYKLTFIKPQEIL